jgi:hypothetical protein
MLRFVTVVSAPAALGDRNDAGAADPKCAVSSMTRCERELTLNELLADPVTQAVMAADRIDPLELGARPHRDGSPSGGGRPRFGFCGQPDHSL